MKHGAVTSALCAIILVSTAQAASGDKATAEMKDRDGKAIGTLSLTETPQGVLLRGELTQLLPGLHGFHVHAVGKCEPPFTSAGGHLNPENKKHGFHDPVGSNAGDLPNLHVSSGGRGVVDALAAGLTLSGGSKGLLDEDGAAVVIHAKADDYKTDPAGDSGDRIVCGIINKAR